MPKKSPPSNNKDARQRIIDRISRIEGQLKGIRRMIEQENQCMDVMTQIMAARSAISMLGLELLKEDIICRREDRRDIDEAYLKTLFTLK